MSKNLIKQDFSEIACSDSNCGAKNIAYGGSYFEIELKGKHINIPTEAHNVNITVNYIKIPNVEYNISVELNNNVFDITGPRASDSVATQYVITIDDGNYSIDSLEEELHRELQEAGALTSPTPIFNFKENTASGKTEIVLNYTTTEVDMNTSTVRDILGFESTTVVGPEATVPKVIKSDNRANFRRRKHYMLISNLGQSGGQRLNSNHRGIICQIPVKVPPGDDIEHEPQHQSPISVHGLKGNQLDILTFQLFDETAKQHVSLNEQIWWINYSISYVIPKPHDNSNEHHK